MIETLLAHVVGKNFAGKNENVKARFLYCKSLFFLSAILILVNSLFWDIGTSIGALLGDQLKFYVLSISKIGVHLFTNLSIIAFVIWLPSTIVYAISEHGLYAYKKDI